MNMLAATSYKRSAWTLTVLAGILSIFAGLSLGRYIYLLNSAPELISSDASGFLFVATLGSWILFNAYTVWSAWRAESQERAKKWFLALAYGLLFEFMLVLIAPRLLEYALCR